MAEFIDSKKLALSAREQEVLLLLQRNTNKEIATSLGVSESTVKSQVDRIFRKLGAKNRTHAVTLAIKSGLIVLEPEREKEESNGTE